MATRINILIVHGVGAGEGGPHYADALVRNVGKEFDRAIGRLKLRDVNARESRAKNALRVEAAFWAPVTQKPQDALIRLVYPGWNPLRAFNLRYQYRRQMANLIGDVIAYQYCSSSAVYSAIHAVLHAGIATLSEASAGERGPDGYAPLTLIGHSLGSVIASDYVWDRTRDATPRHCLVDQGLILSNFYSLGSPMAVYALRNNAGGGIESIRDALDDPIHVEPDSGWWMNMYARDDPIAFPLKPIRSYDNLGVIDRIVDAGTLITAWNPLSHVGYWDSGEVARWIGHKLALDWARINSPEFAAGRWAKAAAALRRDALKA